MAVSQFFCHFPIDPEIAVLLFLHQLRWEWLLPAIANQDTRRCQY